MVAAAARFAAVTRPRPRAPVRCRAVAALEQDLVGETVVVVGLGASGRAAAKLAAARGATVIGVDSKATSAPLESDPELAAAGSRVSSQLGPHNRRTLLDADLLVLSPGVPPRQPDVAAALAAGVPTLSEVAFAFDALPPGLPLAAVTGTNGKSTTTTFAGQLLSAAGMRPFVGGNLGTPLAVAALSLGRSPGMYGCVVLEVSSYQMEFPGRVCPTAAVMLNLTPDHLERHGTLEAYGAAKCRLFARMGPDGLVALPSGEALVRRLAAEAGGAARPAFLGALPGAMVDPASRCVILQLPGAKGAPPGPVERYDLTTFAPDGAHNAANAAAALLLGRALGAPHGVLQSAVSSLRSPPHRMEPVAGVGTDITWVDDSKATNVESSMAGITGISRPAVVLLGGQAKEGVAAGGGLGFGQLLPLLARHRAVVCFGASGGQIAEELRAGGWTGPMVTVPGLAEAVQARGATPRPRRHGSADALNAGGTGVGAAGGHHPVEPRVRQF